MSNFTVPKEIVQLLKCNRCSAFLSEIPVYTGNGGENICHSCSTKIDLSNYHYNVVYVMLAQYLKFPCIYSKRGCKEWIEFNCSREHESVCPYNNCVYKQ